jgi:hypothetical protein
VSIASAITASGQKPRRAISRICALTCSTRAFGRPLVSAASPLSRCAVIVLASLTNSSRRQRLAHSAVEERERLIVGDVVDLAQ